MGTLAPSAPGPVFPMFPAPGPVRHRHGRDPGLRCGRPARCLPTAVICLPDHAKDPEVISVTVATPKSGQEKSHRVPR